MIKNIDWDQILPVWESHLWQGRASAIEPISHMLYLGGTSNQNSNPEFWGYILDGEIAGVNSGHFCQDGSYRSRGLWVFPQYRGSGIGTALLKHTIERAKVLDRKFCWSLPRDSSWPTYERAGFIKTSDWFTTETHDKNAYCQFPIRY